MKTAQIVTVLLALCAAVAAQIVSLNGIISPTVIIIVLAVTNVVSATLPSLLPAAKDATKVGTGLLLLLVFGCTPGQVQQAQSVVQKASNACESRILNFVAPMLLTSKQSDDALAMARYACAAVPCVQTGLEFRQEQLELQKQDAGAPQQAPPAEPADGGFIDPDFSERK